MVGGGGYMYVLIGVLVLLVVYSVRVDAIECTGNFRTYINTNIRGGVSRKDITTEDQCKAACLEADWCQTLDYAAQDVEAACWLHDEYEPRYNSAGVTHYQLVPGTRSCTDTPTVKPSIAPGPSTLNPSILPGPSTLNPSIAPGPSTLNPSVAPTVKTSTLSVQTTTKSTTMRTIISTISTGSTKTTTVGATPVSSAQQRNIPIMSLTSILLLMLFVCV